MKSPVEAFINPSMLTWARSSSGFSLDDAAKKVQVSSERLQAWETGNLRPTVAQLRKLSNIYKRPFAAFYLPSPPSDITSMHDFRRLPNEGLRSESPALRVEIRRAYERREMAIELYENFGDTSPTLSMSASLSDDPDVLATRIRAQLGLSYDIQARWREPYKALNWWRSAFEQQGILVFQVTGIETKEMRGFSINLRPLPIIAVNSKDAPRGRIFTLVHEFIHLLVHEGGMCTLDENQLRTNHDQEVEVFCNRVAGATLVPKRYLELENSVSAKGPLTEWSDEELFHLCSRYQVSREAMLRRLLTLGYTTHEFYQRKRAEFEKEYELLKVERPSAPISPAQKVIGSVGSRFARLILSGYAQDKLTATDVSNILGVRLKHLATIEQALFN